MLKQLLIAASCACTIGTSAATALASSDPSDFSSGSMAAVGAAAPPAPVRAARANAPAPTPIVILPARSAAPVVDVKVLKNVDLGAPEPVVVLRVTLNVDAKLLFTLLDPTGRAVAKWSTIAKQGSLKHTLLLPQEAQLPGTDTLRVAAVGQQSQPKNVRVVVHK
jgi:hypothetical protein